MKKRLCMLLSGILLVGLLSGCGVETGFKVSKSGKVTATSSNTYFTRAEVVQMMAVADDEVDFSQFTKVKVNGKTYYMLSADGAAAEAAESSAAMQEALSEEMKDLITATECVLDMGSSDSSTATEDLGDLFNGQDPTSLIDFYNLSITFPYKVMLTNGTVQSDGKTVVFDIMKLAKSKATAAYAYTTKSAKLIQLAKTDGTIVKNKAYVNAKKIKVATYDKVKSIVVGGKSQTSKSIALAKDGKYTIKVTTANGSKTFTVNRDTKAPTVSGVKSGKTYKKSVTVKFKDAGSGVKTATLDGKTIKSGKTVSAAGSHKLKVVDKAGNSTTIKFTINK